jgi:hypothetical protein
VHILNIQQYSSVASSPRFSSAHGI